MDFQPRPPGLRRRAACFLYESLVVIALLIVASFPVVGFLPAVPTPTSRLVNQGYLFAVAGVYFTWFWRHGGQTLAMKTWQIRLVGASGDRVGLGQAWLRYLLAVLGLCAVGFGFLWALWDREHLYLHDRLAGTRLTRSAPLNADQGGDGGAGEHRQPQEGTQRGGPVVQQTQVPEQAIEQVETQADEDARKYPPTHP
jgi:uncharacterized RDD family membrane protein YckC